MLSWYKISLVSIRNEKMLSTGAVRLCMYSELPRFEEIVVRLSCQTHALPQKKTRMWPVKSNNWHWNSLEHTRSQPCILCDQELLTASFSGTNVPGNKQHIHTQSSKWLSSCKSGLGDCFPFGRQEWVLGGTKARSWLTTTPKSVHARLSSGRPEHTHLTSMGKRTAPCEGPYSLWCGASWR